MGIPPGVPVTATKVHRTLPLVLSRGLSRHTTASTPSGACPGVPAAWLRAAALRSLGKYSLSETDVLRSANDANGADPADKRRIRKWRGSADSGLWSDQGRGRQVR